MKIFISAFFLTTVMYGIVHFSIIFHLLKSTDYHNNRTSSSSMAAATTTIRKPIHWSTATIEDNNNNTMNALVISTAPRTIKHVVALWSELECFTADVDYVILSGPLWSEPILQHITSLARANIPKFAAAAVGKKDDSISIPIVPLHVHVSVNDRYDVGLWCDALAYMEDTGDLSHMHQIELLNDSVFALREYTSILSALQERNVSMTSLSYSMNRPEWTGPDMYWLESIWRGFDRPGLQTFVDYSCRPTANDPMFCPHRKKWWWMLGGQQKGCIVENFERNMVQQFPRDKVWGMFSSDVPRELLTRKHRFPNWVRHPPYWQQLVEEEGFPVAKVNWPDMIASIDDERLNTCTQHLDRSTLVEAIDFSVAVKAI